MPHDADEYAQFILSADTRALVRQLSLDIKTPLGSAYNVVQMLLMTLSPSPAIQEKIDSGELNVEDMLNQLSGLLTETFDVIDFYKDTLEAES
jgi:hypothetical protein